MRINCKQILAKFFSPIIVFLFLVAGMITLFSSSTSYAPTKLSDAELSDVEAQALFNVTYYSGSQPIPFGSRSHYTQSSDTIRLELGFDAYQIAHMNSFKLGYYDGGWDNDTTNYFWGTTDRTTPLLWTGIFVDFGFDNYSNNSTRVLNYVEIGTMSCSGTVTGTINTVTALINGGTGTNGGVMLRQTASGQRIITYENEILSFVFATKYEYVNPGGSTHSNLSGIFIKMPDYNSSSDEAHP